MKIKAVIGAVVLGLMTTTVAMAQETNTLRTVWSKSVQATQDVPTWVKNLDVKQVLVGKDAKGNSIYKSHKLVIAPNGRHKADGEIYSMFDVCPADFCEKEFLQIVVDSKVGNSWGTYKNLATKKVVYINNPEGKLKKILDDGVASYPHKNMAQRANWN